MATPQRTAFLLFLSLVLSTMLGSSASASVFYKLDVIAKSGDESMTGMGDGVSINEKGLVAFVGKFSVGDGIFVGDGKTTPRFLSSGWTDSTRTFSAAVQINNDNKIVAYHRVAGATARTFIQLWDGDSGGFLGDFATADSGGTGDFAAVQSHPSISDMGQAAFASLSGTQWSLTTGSRPSFSTFPVRRTPTRPMVADPGLVVVRTGNTSTDPIVMFSYDLSIRTTIASTAMGFTSLGASPSISRFGWAVAFAADLSESGAAALGISPGPGIFASIRLPDASRKIVRVAGLKVEDNSAAGGNDNGVWQAGEVAKQAAELGYDSGGNAIYFQNFDLDARVGVLHQMLGVSDVYEDSYTFSFFATPSSPSRDNPQLPGTTLLFSGEKGLWTVRVDAERFLFPAFGEGWLTFHATGPLPVAQVGDVIGGRIITGLSSHDPIDYAAYDDAGILRTQRRGDHVIAFWASTDSGDMVVRGSYLDSDQDGLLDHWEKDGIDMDQDGSVDLDLAAMGADPFKRDIFVEIDWLADDPTHVHEPAPGGISRLLPLVFRNDAPSLPGNRYGMMSDKAGATLTPADIPAGITFHIDAGYGNDAGGNPFSANMESAALHGGNKVGQRTDTTKHLDLVYMGVPGSREATLTSMGITGVQVRSFSDIKDQHFGDGDKRARELAFTYCLLADFHSFFPNRATPTVINVSSGANVDFDGDGKTDRAELYSPGTPYAGVSMGGHGVKIISGTGAGQVRRITGNDSFTLYLDDPWTTLPDSTSQIVFFHGSSGLSEVFFEPGTVDYNSLPGNDVMLNLRGFGINRTTPRRWLSTGYVQWRTLMHEFGHTLGLRHGGIDHKQFKPDNVYRSIMSYTHQNKPRDKYITAGIEPVNSYAFAGDKSYPDWLYIKRDFIRTTFFLGNSFGKALGDEAPEPEEMTVEDYRRLYGRDIDLDGPTLKIVSPSAGASLAQGSRLVAMLNASDNVGLDSVTVGFDLNGDGTINETTETLKAKKLTNTSYQVTFPPLSGPVGDRAIRAMAQDTSLNSVKAETSIKVTTPLQTPTDVTGSVEITRGTVRSGPLRAYFQTVTLRNIGAANIASPLSLILNDLPAGVRLNNQTGSTVLTAPAGVPYINVNVGADGVLSPGEAVTVALAFSSPTRPTLTYTTRVLAGPGNR